MGYFSPDACKKASMAAAKVWGQRLRWGHHLQLSSQLHQCSVIKDANVASCPMLLDSASGPEIKLPGQISVGF